MADPEIRFVGGEAVIQLVDGMTPTFGDDIAAAIERLLGEGHRRFVVNFAGVTRLDSAGLGAIVSASVMVQRRGGSLRIEGSSGQPGEALGVTGQGS
jgi:anti-anti-sigma factor